jgi:hypothetical protein
MSPLTIAVIAVLTVWFALTAIVQLPSERARSLRRLDPTGHLLPGWNFFAPKPIQADFAVWFRCWDAYDPGCEEVVQAAGGQWCELAGIEQRRLTDTVVNPGRYTRKSIFTCCTAIARAVRQLDYRPGEAPDHPPDAIMISLPYLLLAEKVSSMCAGAVAMQFRIDVVGYHASAPRASMIFRSAVHRVVAQESHVAAS